MGIVLAISYQLMTFNFAVHGKSNTLYDLSRKNSVISRQPSDLTWNQRQAVSYFQCLSDKIHSVTLLKEDETGPLSIQLVTKAGECGAHENKFTFERNKSFSENDHFFSIFNFHLVDPYLDDTPFKAFSDGILDLILVDRRLLTDEKMKSYHAYDASLLSINLRYFLNGHDSTSAEPFRDVGDFQSTFESNDQWNVQDLKITHSETKNLGSDPRFPGHDFVYQRNYFEYQYVCQRFNKSLSGNYTSNWKRIH